MDLFLCEKPSQAKDIGAVLGVLSGRQDGFFQKGNLAVTWAFGHILTQATPEMYGAQFADFYNIDALPIIPKQWLLQVSEKASKQFKIIKKLLSQAHRVIIATDADREGEVIARELLDFCAYRGEIQRFWTSGLDTRSVKKALSKLMPGSKTENLYHAGLVRGRADWLVGMNLSRAYTVAYSGGFGTLSVGRIQTPTLNLVVQRDACIENFQPYSYYTLSADFQAASGLFKAIWQVPDALKNTDGFCTDKTVVDRLASMLPNCSALVQSAKTERKLVPPPLPYSLSALQKDAGRRFGLSPKKVLDIAQSLYEKHKITSYPRTPCQYLPTSQKAEVQTVLDALILIDPSLQKVMPQLNLERESRVWSDTQVNKHSHHAIIPTTKNSFNLEELTRDERHLYLMIRNRYLAQFLPDYEFDGSVIEIIACDQLFRATGQIPRVMGWKSFLTETDHKTKGKSHESDADDGTHQALPPVKTGETVCGKTAYPETKKNVPPPHFTETTLLEEMRTLSDFFKTIKDEQIKKILRSTEGLGTEATRGAIIERLFEMGYIEKQKGKVLATEKGKNLIARIPPQIADPVTTAKWELALGAIEEGRLSPEEFMAYQENLIRQLVTEAQQIAPKERPRLERKTGTKAAYKPKYKAGDSCPKCQVGNLKALFMKNDPKKRYLGCSKFPECRFFEWLQ